MKKIVVLFFIFFILCAATLLWWEYNLLPVNSNDTSKYNFDVIKGESVRTIGYALKQKNLIRSPVVFFLLVKQKGLENNIQAGNFTLSPSENVDQIVQDLTHGIVDVWVTIPEGKRAEEISAILKGKLPTYKSTWTASLKAKEGYLFPDTYLIPNTADISFILSMFKKNFDVHFNQTKQNQTARLTDAQVVTIASLVEREAQFPQDRPLIASVIENRLAISMALQIDATVQYALGYQIQENTWWKKILTAEDLKFPSAYNTYLNVGLPPGPICNPGASAMEAAAHPTHTDFLYYMADKSGHTHYAKTLDEQNANINRYGL